MTLLPSNEKIRIRWSPLITIQETDRFVLQCAVSFVTTKIDLILYI